jgi:outer membrane biosynthesis protein TonB
MQQGPKHTCSWDAPTTEGSTNPEYESTQQGLTDEQGEYDSEMQAQGNQGEVLVRIKVLLHKSY